MFAAGLYNSGMIYASKVFDSWMFPPFHLVVGSHLACVMEVSTTSWMSYQRKIMLMALPATMSTPTIAPTSVLANYFCRASLDSHWSFLQGLKFGLLTSTTIDF
jgi:hypothetical protein